MRRTYILVHSAAVFLLATVVQATTMPACIVNQPESGEISAEIPGPGSADPITWTVDGVRTDNVGPKTKFIIEPWDTIPHNLSALDKTGTKICDANLLARALPASANIYIDPFPVINPFAVGAQGPTKDGVGRATILYGMASGDPNQSRPDSWPTGISMVKPAMGTQGGSIAGELKSPAKEPVVGADVKIINLETGVTRLTKTSSTGTYEVQRLEAGKYNVTVTQPGFSAWKLGDVVVDSRPPQPALTTPVKVYYATERELVTPPPNLDYGQKRSADDSIRYGVAVVTVPKTTTLRSMLPVFRR
jgi:hypothetical protein